jgi:hypothetical protein
MSPDHDSNETGDDPPLDETEASEQAYALRSAAPDADLRAGRVEVVSVTAIDFADLLADADYGRRRLQELRANDTFADEFEAIIKVVPDCTSTRQEIIDRTDDAKAKGGKAVWTTEFLTRFAPVRLPHHEFVQNGTVVHPQARLSSRRGDVLHHVALEDSKLQMFRDGTLCHTVRVVFKPHSSGAKEEECPPATVSELVDRLGALNKAVATALRPALEAFVRELGAPLKSKLDLQLKAPDALTRAQLSARSKTHTVIFVERFYDGPKIDALCQTPFSLENAAQAGAAVALHTVLTSSALPGILNTATWYRRYNARYVAALAGKEIGYRDDEIYLTDRKATIVSTPGLWDQADSLSEYKDDIVLAVEYNVARLAYFASTLAYYQGHPDVRKLDKEPPLDALAHVIHGRAILSYIDESLDLTLLVDHGFTRLLVERLREELKFETAIGFIRQRVQDASDTVSLRSSVDGAEHTQRGLWKWTKAAVVIALLIGVATLVVTLLSWRDSAKDRPLLPPSTQICVRAATTGTYVARPCPAGPETR